MHVNGWQGTKRRRNIAENYNRLSRVHERYRRQTDRRATAYSERERERSLIKLQSYKFIRRIRRYVPPYEMPADVSHHLASVSMLATHTAERSALERQRRSLPQIQELPQVL